MVIKYYCHACFTLADEKIKIVIDPFGDIGYKQDFIKADLCLCSHLHHDHYAIDSVEVKEIITENTQKYSDFITAIATFHDEVGGAKRGKNSIFKIVLDGKTVCHFGDLGMPFSKKLVNEIGRVDILLIPVGGNYTIDATEAEKYVRAINPKVVIPMHYKTNRSDIDIAEKQDFLKLFSSSIKMPREFEISNQLLENGINVLDIDDSDF